MSWVVEEGSATMELWLISSSCRSESEPRLFIISSFLLYSFLWWNSVHCKPISWGNCCKLLWERSSCVRLEKFWIVGGIVVNSFPPRRSVTNDFIDSIFVWFWFWFWFWFGWMPMYDKFYFENYQSPWEMCQIFCLRDPSIVFEGNLSWPDHNLDHRMKFRVQKENFLN